MPVIHSAGTFDKTPEQHREAAEANKNRNAEDRKFWQDNRSKIVLIAVGKSKNAGKSKF